VAALVVDRADVILASPRRDRAALAAARAEEEADA
jgi:hypothetical protein